MPYKDPEKQKEYNKKYLKGWYERNKESHKINTRRNKKAQQLKMSKFVNGYKTSQGCSKCPEKDFVCLDFHHNGNDKEMDISKAVFYGWSKNRIMKEIDKCMVVCANCHRKLHASLLRG